MISVERLDANNEPPLFEKNCREPGRAWLAANPKRDPHEQCGWWRQFQPDLARHFEYRCGWLACNIGLEGDVDHWIPCDVDRALSFEWSNYRYCAGTINSLKSADPTLLDPCEIGHDWFQVSLPDFQLLPTVNIPQEYAERAKATLDKLQLRRGHYARWNRWSWYARHWHNGQPNLSDLNRDAPLVAAACRRAQESGLALPDPAATEPIGTVQARQRRWAPRTRKGSDPSNSRPDP